MVFGRGFESHRLHQFLLYDKTFLSIHNRIVTYIINYSLINSREKRSGQPVA